MKRFLFAILLFLMLLTGIFLFQWQTMRTATDFTEYALRIEKQVNEHRISEAETELDAFYKEWQKKNKWMYLSMNHRKIRDIETAANRLGACIKHEDWGGAASALGDLKEEIEEIPKVERLNLENVL